MTRYEVTCKVKIRLPGSNIVLQSKRAGWTCFKFFLFKVFQLLLKTLSKSIRRSSDSTEQPGPGWPTVSAGALLLSFPPLVLILEDSISPYLS